MRPECEKPPHEGGDYVVRRKICACRGNRPEHRRYGSGRAQAAKECRLSEHPRSPVLSVPFRLPTRTVRKPPAAAALDTTTACLSRGNRSGDQPGAERAAS